jgi:hypothetical protein
LFSLSIVRSAVVRHTSSHRYTDAKLLRKFAAAIVVQLANRFTIKTRA